MKGPLEIMVELVGGLIHNTVITLQFVFIKLIELFGALAQMAGTSPIGFLIAIFIGAVVVTLMLKFVLGSSRTLVWLGVGAIVLVIIIFFFVLLSSSV